MKSERAKTELPFGTLFPRRFKAKDVWEACGVLSFEIARHGSD